MTTTPRELLELSYSDPARAIECGADVLDEVDDATSDEAVTLRALSIAHTLMSELDEAIRLAQLARSSARAAGDDEEYVLATLAMAGPTTVARTAEDAFDLIESVADRATTPYLAARVHYQRGVALTHMGEAIRAAEEFEAALPGLRAADDSMTTRKALQNLGGLKIDAGELEEAELVLTQALRIAEERGEEPSVSGIKHNLGRLASYRGDLTEALSLLLDSDEIYMRLTGFSAPQHSARCEVLLSAGLFTEARRLARRIVERNRAAGDSEHLATSLLVEAKASMAAGELAEARDTAAEAARLFADHGRLGDAMEARARATEAEYRLEGASKGLLDRASDIAAAFESEKQVVAGAQARLLAGRIAIDLGELDAALDHLGRVSPIESGPVELRIQARVARATIRLIENDVTGAMLAVRSGLDILDDYQAAIGATDMRMAIERQGSELTAMGLRLAMQSARPRRVLDWMDRTRARALRHHPVTSRQMDEVQHLLSNLRQVEARLMSENRGDERLIQERRRLQEKITRADRRKRSTSAEVSRVTTDELIDGLGHRALLELGIVDGRLRGVLVRDGKARLLDMVDAREVVAELAHGRFAMRRAARMGRPLGFSDLERLDRLLFGDLELTDDPEVVVVPPPSLMAAPWAALQTLRGSTVVISPSAEMWWRSSRRPRQDGPVVLAGGPDLKIAGPEVEAVATLHGDALVFPPGASVEEVKSAVDGASLAHVACHATFNVENPMFSALRLGDGDLNVYDVERLADPPSMVVLSACDSGYTEARSGDELAGLTSALLSMGTRSVVASVGLVPDTPTTSELMVDFHRGLIEGLEPAPALARAQSAMLDDPERFVAAASFVCVGA
jgi:tetratricopeptide (TPR) repeat protein